MHWTTGRVGKSPQKINLKAGNWHLTSSKMTHSKPIRVTSITRHQLALPMNHGTGGGKRLSEIEWQLFARVKEAQARYWKALEHQQLMIAELDQALMKDVDGSFALALSKLAAKLGLDDVVRCQETLVKLMLRQEIPSTAEEA
jgi:hypothetical protein